MPSKNIAIRLSLQDADVVRRSLMTLGADGQKALQRIEAGARPASRGLMAVNAVSRQAQINMSSMGSRLGFVGAALTALGPAGVAAAAGITGVVIAIGLMVRHGSRAVQVAADVAESVAKFETVFKDQSAAAAAWAKETGDAIGRSRFSLMEYLATVQDTFVPLGFAREQAAGLSKELVTLAIDLASFNNASESETIQLLTSALVGNHDAVRRFGIVMTETTLKAELFRMGIEGGVKAASELEKTQARLNLIFRQSADAQGDAARTADSYVNRQRALDEAFKDLSVTIGTLFMPAASQLLEWSIEATRGWDALINRFRDLNDLDVGQLQGRLASLRAELAELYEERDSSFNKDIIPPSFDTPYFRAFDSEVEKKYAEIQKLNDLIIVLQSAGDGGAPDNQIGPTPFDVKTFEGIKRALEDVRQAEVKRKKAVNNSSLAMAIENSQMRQLIGAYALGSGAIADLTREFELENEAQKVGVKLGSDLGIIWSDNFREGQNLKDVLGELEDAQRANAEAAKEISGSVKQSFADWATGAKSAKDAMDGLLLSVERTLLNKVYDKTVGIAVDGIVEGMFKTNHTGGFVGEGHQTRPANPFVFAGAPRLHGGGQVPGLRRGEVPIIALEKERVLTEAQQANTARTIAGLAAMAGSGQRSGGVVVNPTVYVNTPGVTARTQSSWGAGGELNLDIFVERIESQMTDNIGRGEGMAPVMEQRYGLNPAAGAKR